MSKTLTSAELDALIRDAESRRDEAERIGARHWAMTETEIIQILCRFQTQSHITEGEMK